MHEKWIHLQYGGALSVDGGDLTLVGCEFESNKAYEAMTLDLSRMLQKKMP